MGIFHDFYEQTLIQNIIKGTHSLMYSPNSLNQKADVLPFHLRVFQFRALREMQQLFNILLRVRFVLF